MGVEFYTPFIVPLGVALLSATLDSVTREGPQLGVHQGALWTVYGIRRAALHVSGYMHHLYLGCFAFDLSAVVSVQQLGDVIDFQISSTEKPVIETLTWVVLAVIVHILAYVHTIFIGREFKEKRAERPITFLHLVYAPVSIGLMVLIRL